MNKPNFKKVWNKKERFFYYGLSLLKYLFAILGSCIIIFEFKLIGLNQTEINLIFVIILVTLPMFIKRFILNKTTPFKPLAKKDFFKEARGEICELENRSWSEHELRCLIQDEISCLQNQGETER